MPHRLNRHVSRSLYWDVHTGTGHASYGVSVLALSKAPKLNGKSVEAIDYSPLVRLTMILDTESGAWRQLTIDEMANIDKRLREMIRLGLSVWD